MKKIIINNNKIISKFCFDYYLLSLYNKKNKNKKMANQFK